MSEYARNRDEICSKQPCGYCRIAGKPSSLGSHGEVEKVTLKTPLAPSHALGATEPALKLEPFTVVATVSCRSTVGSRIGSEISTASVSPISEFASKRIFAPDE